MNDRRGRVNGHIEGLSVPTSHQVEGDPEVWEAMLDALDDQQVDALLGGSVLHEELAPISEVMRRLRRSANGEPVPPMNPTLRALLDEPARGVSRVASGSVRHAFVKAAAAAAAVAVLAAGAAENRLPAGIQDVVSSSADLVGIFVPRSEDRHAEGPGADRLDVGVRDQGNDDSAPDHDTATPGTPGDRDASTQPAPHNGGGIPEGPTSTKASETGQANGTGDAGSHGNGSSRSSETGQANGTGVAGSHGNGSSRSSAAGQANGTGNTKAG